MRTIINKISLFPAIILLTFSFYNLSIYAQEKIIIHKSGNSIYSTPVENIDSIKFINNNSFFNTKTGLTEIPISDIDSITFETEPINTTDIYITYNNQAVEIINPYEKDGITISTNQANVEVATVDGINLKNIKYHIAGNTANGSLLITSNDDITLLLENINLVNPNGAAIQIKGNIITNIELIGNSNSLSDGTGSTKNAALLTKGNLIFDGTGRLNIIGIKKHGISSDESITVNNGSIYVTQSASDGLHSEGFIMNSGTIDINGTIGDGIDAGTKYILINGGDITINSTAKDVKGIKCDSTLQINNCNINMIIAGEQSKGLSSKKDIIINDGNLNIMTSGAAVLTTLGSGYDVSYCTAIKADSNITINGGIINIDGKSTNNGGRGFSGNNITVSGGKITVSSAGNGATYINEKGVKDSYTACCIKADSNIALLKGSITCSSSGTGGKNISADGSLIIGNIGENNENLLINAATSGEHFLVSGSGMDADYANPKAIKSEGKLIVNSGTIKIVCSQKGEGGEGLESKDTLIINGGIINIQAYDDCINAAKHIEIKGGTTYCVSSGNDGIDCNGTMTISGGFTISSGTRAPEEGFDCDQNRFAITGGIIIGTGGATSTPTANACTQYSIIYTGTPGNAVCIKNSAGEAILMYQMPTLPTTGGGGGPGGNSMVLLFSDPRFSNGAYTLQYGGSISGGTTINGYNTGGTYSGGSSKNFTISSMVTNVK